LRRRDRCQREQRQDHSDRSHSVPLGGRPPIRSGGVHAFIPPDVAGARRMMPRTLG
jgi:hypothetical protein